MKRKAVSGIMLTLLLVSMLTVTFNIPPIVADTATAELSGDSSTVQEAEGCNPLNPTDSHGSFLREGINRNASAKENPRPYSVDEDKWNINETNEWTDFAKVDGDSAELVIGVNNGNPNNYVEIEGLVGENGGELVGTVSMEGEVKAAVADIPFAAISSFVTQVWDADLSRYVEPNMKFQACFVPNDPYWSSQWGPRIIEADYAWNTTIGDPSVLVAVIDTGIDWNHPDLAANYVPLGYDWVNDDTDPMDDEGHGTHCAGILSAVINNSIGVAGLAQVLIMAEKGLDQYGGGYEDDLANAIIHAVDQGADILSNSWGSYAPSMLIYDAIQYAYDNDVLVIAAAANDAVSQKHYPAAYDEVVAVTATDSYDDPAWFTNFGDWVELAAPGVDIYSTVWDDSYTYMSGTSMATPHVAGVAALISSQFPNMTRDQLRLQLRFTADDLGDAGFDDYYGYGRINARRAVEQAPPAHDLLILDWETPPIVEPGASATVNTTVFNFGAFNETDITVQLLVNGSIVDSAPIDFLETATSETVNCTWTPMVEGTYNVTSYVVPIPGENFTANNLRTRFIRVGYAVMIATIETHGETLHTEQLATYYTSLGHIVERITTTITPQLLDNYDIAIVGEWGGTWLYSEIAAMQAFIDSGKGLVAIGDELDMYVQEILGTYGISYAGISAPGGSSSHFDPLHPIMQGVSLIYAGSPVNSLHATAPAYWIANDASDTHTLIAGAEVGGYVLCLSNDFAYYLHADDNEVMFKNIVDWMTVKHEHELVVRLDTPNFLEPGDSSLLNATVYNNGLSNETDVELFLLINGTIGNSATIPELTTGSSYKLSYLWAPIVEAMYNITGYTVPVQNETLTENNLAWTYVYVGSVVKAFVLHSAGTYMPNVIRTWQELNTNWYVYGGTMIYIDYTTLDKDNITHDDIVATDADVLIISCAADPWMGWEFTDSEIEAITRYVREGHGLIATAGTLYYMVPNNNKLAPLFGIDETIDWHAAYTDLLHIQDPLHPLLINVPNPYTFRQVQSAYPPDGTWDWNELAGGTYVALGHYKESAIVVHRGLVYISPWLEIIPPYYHHHLQLLYNAIAWSRFEKPEHELIVHLESPAALKPGDSTLLNATVSNMGLNKETDVELQLLINGITVDSVVIPELLTGSSHTLSYLWTPTEEGTYNVTAYAPPLTDEEFIENNSESTIVFVYYTLTALLKNIDPWDYPSNEEALSLYDVPYSVFDSSDFGSIDLSPFSKVVIASDQDQAFYNAMDAYRWWFEDYVSNGGVLEIHAADWGWHGGGWVGPLPGGLQWIGTCSDYVTIVDPAHPVVTEPHSITDAELDYWGCSVHGYFGTYPVNSDVVMIEDYTGYPVYLEFQYGAGCIVASSQTLEWAHQHLYSLILENSLLYTAIRYPHDLAVTLDAPASLELGNSVLLNATVRNRGLNNETDVELWLLINGTLVNSVTITELLVDEFHTISCLWTPTASGPYNITAYAPPVPGEEYTMNNILTKRTYIFFYMRLYLPNEWMGGGAPMGWHADDGSWSYTLPFDFPFYGIHYRTIHISSNGLITFIGPDSSYGNSIPSLAGKLAMAPAWDDWETYPPHDIYIWQNSTHVGVRWEVAALYDSSILANFEAILRADGVMQFNYEYNNGPISATIGISNGAGHILAEDVTSLNYIHTIMFTPFQPEHELVVDLDAPAFIEPGDSTLLNATVLNLGISNETNVELFLLINGTTVNSTTIPELQVGESHAINYWWTPTVEGIFNVTAYAPSMPHENVTANNIVMEMVYVRYVDVALISDQSELLAITGILDSMGIGYDIYNDNSMYLYTEYLSLLLNYSTVIFYTDYRHITIDEYSALESYLSAGGNLLATGFDCLVGDWRLADLVRSSSYGDNTGEPDLYVVDETHPIMNGPYGSFPVGYHISGLPSDCDAVEADVARNAVTVAELADGYDKIIATEGLLERIVFWNGIGTDDWMWNVDCEAMLKNMLDWFSAPLIPRDVAVISVTISATEVYEGQIVNVTVVARNEGNLTETFDVTVYYDASVIGIQTVTNLTAGANATLNFSWDTTGVTPSIINYMIKAVATEVPGEVDTADNIYVDGGVKVKMVGDVNGDGIINIKDIVIAALAIDSRPSDPNWNPFADLNQDGIINIIDLVIMGVNFGKTIARAGHPAQAIWVEPDLIEGVPICDTFVVDVFINITAPTLPGGGSGLFGFEYKLQWNNTVLEVVEIQTHTDNMPSGDRLLGWDMVFVVNNDTSTPGVHGYAVTAITGVGFTGVASLCTYTFHVVGNGSCALDIYEEILVDDTATQIPHTTVDGYFTNVV